MISSNSLAVVSVIEGKVLLSDYRATVGRDNFTDLLVHRVWPDIVSRRQVEFLRPRLLHQPGNERLDLLRWHRAGTEDERVAFLSLVLLRVDVKLLALHDSRTLDSLPRGAVNATEDHIDLILLDELGSFGLRNTICSCTVLKVQIDLSPQQATVCIDVINHHLGHVRIGDAHERECTRLVRDYAHLDG